MLSRLFLASFSLLLALAGPAAARGTLDSILPEIRAQHPGRLSDAEPWTDSEGRTHYRIKWMTPEGRILFFNADADSGRYSSSGGGDYDPGPRGGHRARGDDDENGQSSDDAGGRRNHWTGDNGDGRSHWNGGDGGQHGGDWNGGGDRHGGDRGGDRGDWRGGQNGGDNGGDGGGRHHHHGGD